MKNIVVIIILLLNSTILNAEEFLCPFKGNENWEKIKEIDFSKEKVNTHLIEFQKWFNGNNVVAEEYMEQSLIIIEGGVLRQSIEYWKREKNSQNVKIWTTRFCEFMEKKAYLVH